MTYLLDANVFIQAKNLHYGLDFARPSGTGFFRTTRLDRCSASTRWRTKSRRARMTSPNGRGIARVACSGRPTHVAIEFGRVSVWVTRQRYGPAAINTFLQVADYYLLAHAVVIHEVPANSMKRIKIPNVCIGLDVRFMTPYEMLRRERARFVLRKDAA